MPLATLAHHPPCPPHSSASTLTPHPCRIATQASDLAARNRARNGAVSSVLAHLTGAEARASAPKFDAVRRNKQVRARPPPTRRTNLALSRPADFRCFPPHSRHASARACAHTYYLTHTREGVRRITHHQPQPQPRHSPIRRFLTHEHTHSITYPAHLRRRLHEQASEHRKENNNSIRSQRIADSRLAPAAQLIARPKAPTLQARAVV
jgi:hypothetical protein